MSTSPRSATDSSDEDMPKDWNRQRTLIEQLYFTEKKTLDEVRELMRNEHGFEASTRAYRMKIDDWGLRKYKSNKNKRAAKSLRTPQSLPEQEVDTTSESTTYTNDTLRSTTESDTEYPDLEPEEDDKLRLSRESALLSNALETLFAKWSPIGREDAISLHPEYRSWIDLSSRHQGPLIFRLVESLVPHEEQFNVGKFFLENDLDAQKRPAYPYVHWRDAWVELLDSNDWEDAKERLTEGIISDIAGNTFKDYAMVVIAERQLAHCKTEIDYCRQPNRVVRAYEAEDASRHRKKYLDILKDFRHTNRDVSPSWYKYSLDIIEWEVARNKDSNRVPDADHIADEYRHKYLKLICQYNNALTHSTSNPSSPLIRDLTDEPVGHHTPDRSSPRSKLSKDDPASSREAFETLLIKWKTLTNFNEYAHHVIAKDGWPVFIFDAPFPGSENLFSIIASDVPVGEQIPLVKALLVAFSSVKLTDHYSPWSLSWWSSVYTSDCWETFLKRLDMVRISEHMKRIMSPEAVKLFLDATILLIGERLLLDLKTMLVKDRREKSGKVDSEALKNQYRDILREFGVRKLTFDQGWVGYLLNFM